MIIERCYIFFVRCKINLIGLKYSFNKSNNCFHLLFFSTMNLGVSYHFSQHLYKCNKIWKMPIMPSKNSPNKSKLINSYHVINKS